MANRWRARIDKALQPHVEAQIRAAAYHRDAYEKATDPSNAQLWVAIANLSKQVLDLHHQLQYLEKTLQDSILKQTLQGKKPVKREKSKQ